MRAKSCFIFICCGLMGLLWGCGGQPAAKMTPAGQVTAPAPVSTLPAARVTITGWFETVWNGEPHYSITDQNNQTTDLLLDDAVARPLGGPLELDRKRVTLVGVVTLASPRTVRVLSIQFAGNE